MEIVPIPSDSFTLGFIGAGKMAESIARGAVGSGVLPPSRIRTAHSNPARRAAFESIGITLLPSNDDVCSFFASLLFSLEQIKKNMRRPFIISNNSLQVVRESNVVVFSVKPQVGMATVSTQRW